MKNIHLLQTDKPSRIIYNDANQLCYQSNKSFRNDRKNRKKFNIYITNDEEIKEGDWFHLDMSHSDTLPDEIHQMGNDNWSKTGGIHFCEGNSWVKSCKKIILTTDDQLIDDGVQAIDDEFLEWFVKNPSCEEVKIIEDKKLSSKNIYSAVEGDLAYNHHGHGGIINNLSNDVRVGIGNYLETALTSKTGWETLDINNYRIYDKCYKIIIPKEEPKQEVNYYSSNLVTEKKEAIEFADYLLGNYEMAEFEKEHPKYVVDDELCWQLAGTQQKYTSVEMYQIWLNESTKTK